MHPEEIRFKETDIILTGFVWCGNGQAKQTWTMDYQWLYLKYAIYYMYNIIDTSTMQVVTISLFLVVISNFSILDECGGCFFENCIILV